MDNISTIVLTLDNKYIVTIINILKNLEKYEYYPIFQYFISILHNISSQNDNSINDLMIKYDFIKHCCQCLLKEYKSLMVSAIICLHTICCTIDFSALDLLNTNIFPKKKIILDNKKNVYSLELRKELCCMISNYARGLLLHTDALILFKIAESLISIMNNECYEIAIEA